MARVVIRELKHQQLRRIGVVMGCDTGNPIIIYQYIIFGNLSRQIDLTLLNFRAWREYVPLGFWPLV